MPKTLGFTGKTMILGIFFKMRKMGLEPIFLDLKTLDFTGFLDFHDKFHDKISSE